MAKTYWMGLNVNYDEIHKILTST